jgi:hypothetical protein
MVERSLDLDKVLGAPAFGSDPPPWRHLTLPPAFHALVAASSNAARAEPELGPTQRLVLPPEFHSLLRGPSSVHKENSSTCCLNAFNEGSVFESQTSTIPSPGECQQPAIPSPSQTVTPAGAAIVEAVASASLSQHVARHHCGDMNVECDHCKALFFPGETMRCCRHGRVSLPFYRTPPDPLLSFLQKLDFVEDIRRYNTRLALASAISSETKLGWGVVRVEGKITHHIGWCFECYR